VLYFFLFFVALNFSRDVIEIVNAYYTCFPYSLQPIIVCILFNYILKDKQKKNRLNNDGTVKMKQLDTGIDSV